MESNENGKQHIKNNKYQNALIYYNDILNKFDFAIEKLKTEKQIQQLVKQIKIPAHKNLSLCYLKLNQYKKAINQCQQVLNLQPNCVKILYRIGKSLTILKRYNQAEQYLKRAFANNPHEQQILKALQQLQLAKQKPKHNQDSSLKKIVSLIFYWPLFILNTILAKIFSILNVNYDKNKQN